MNAAERLFVSLALPPVCREALGGLQENTPDVGWTPPEQFHLTMRFLGDVEAPLAARIEEKLASVRVEPFLLPLAGAGRFPPRGPARVLWVGVGRGHTRLHQLRKKIDDAALAAGWRGELRNFDPHITLGRVRDGADAVAIERWLKAYAGFEGPPFRVASFDLIASELQHGGAVHTLKRRFSLPGGV